MHDLSARRADFPVLARRFDAGPLIYLDSAATSLKPRPVIEAVVSYYEVCTANVRRAVHALSEEASERFEAARERIARFIGAEAREIVFVRNATEAVNLVARSFARDAKVAVSRAEHHSNLLPWRETHLIDLEIDRYGGIDLERARLVLPQERPALLAFSLIGNALGTRQPARELIELAHSVNARVLVDASQAVGHEPLDVRSLDVDFLCFSGHKMLGPNGVGILYVRPGCEEMLKPLLLGGSMVQSVQLDEHVPLDFPWRLEAGTPATEGVFGLAAACDYLDDIGLETIDQHTRALTAKLRDGLSTIDRIRLHGDGNSRSSIVSFSLTGMQAHGVARILSNRYGIMARSGFHCAQPLHIALKLPETIRFSVHLYNDMAEVETCIRALKTIAQMP